MTYFAKVTRRALATAKPFTAAQEARIRKLAACGPCVYDAEVDDALALSGWLQPYGDDAVDLADVAMQTGIDGACVIFDSRGSMHKHLLAR